MKTKDIKIILIALLIGISLSAANNSVMFRHNIEEVSAPVTTVDPSLGYTPSVRPIAQPTAPPSTAPQPTAPPPTTPPPTTPPPTTPPPTTPPIPLFNFAIMLSPASFTVDQGGVASYQILFTFSDPYYYGTIVNIQVTGLGSGMTHQLISGGGLSIATSTDTPPGTYPFTVLGSAYGVTHQTSGTLIVIDSTSSEEETATTLIEPTSSTTIDPDGTITEQITTQTTTPTTDARTDEEGSDLTSQLLNPTILMVIIIAVLATALITTLLQRRK
jgi:hypothetical protein